MALTAGGVSAFLIWFFFLFRPLALMLLMLVMHFLIAWFFCSGASTWLAPAMSRWFFYSCWAGRQQLPPVGPAICMCSSRGAVNASSPHQATTSLLRQNGRLLLSTPRRISWKNFSSIHHPFPLQNVPVAVARKLSFAVFFFPLIIFNFFSFFIPVLEFFPKVCFLPAVSGDFSRCCRANFCWFLGACSTTGHGRPTRCLSFDSVLDRVMAPHVMVKTYFHLHWFLVFFSRFLYYCPLR